MTAEEVNVIITAQNREFNNAINGVINRLDDMEERTRHYGDSATGVFKKVAQAASALGIGKIISDSIMSGGELEQNLGGAEVVFRQHADSMRNTAKTAFKDMGLSESGYLAAANKMGALLKGSGYDIASAAKTSQQVMQRASDVASIMGIDVASAMEAVTGAAKGNFTMMDNLGVAINDTTLQIYAQEKGLGKLETTQQKVSAAMQMFLEKTEYAAGNYARENDTFSGSLTTFKAEIENLTADLGTQLLPTATSLLSMARSGLEAVSPLVVSLGEGINQVATFLTNLSPTAKTMLTISLLSAVAIPAVTKAQLLYNAANAKWKDLLNILIPKEITRANVLKATVGWLAIIAGMLALVADIGATAREMNSSEGEAMQDTADGADTASESVDGLADSYAGLGNSADSAKKSLLDIDTLNVFGGSESSTGIMDFSAAINGATNAEYALNEAKDAASEFEKEINKLTNRNDYVESPFKASTASGGSAVDDVARAAVSAHAGNADIHVTAAEKAGWNEINYINPNLLDNSDFKINQAGKSVYSEGEKECLDRWVVQADSTGGITVSPLDPGGVRIENTGSNVGIRQNICSGVIKEGESYTMSVEIDGTRYSAILNADKNGSIVPYGETPYYSALTYFSEADIWFAYPYVVYTGEYSVELKNAKLEPGTTATPFVAPNAAIENVKIKSSSYIGGYNGIHADTLDGKHTDDFIYARGYFDSIDLNEIRYPCSGLATGCSNAPTDKMWGTLIVFAGGTGSFTQIYVVATLEGVPSDVWIRQYPLADNQLEWTPWRNTADGGNAALVGNHPSSDFVLKSDYDALVARVAALEGGTT